MFPLPSSSPPSTLGFTLAPLPSLYLTISNPICSHCQAHCDYVLNQVLPHLLHVIHLGFLDIDNLLLILVFLNILVRMFSFNMPSTLISWFIFILIFRYRPLLIVVFYSSFVSIATAVQWLTLVPLKSCFFLDPNQKTPQFSQKWCDSSILKSFLVCQAKIRPLCTLVFFQIPSPSAQNGPFCFLSDL